MRHFPYQLLNTAILAGFILAGTLSFLAPAVQGQQAPPPPAPNTEYWQQYAETLAVSRQACEQGQISLRLQGATDQRRLAEVQQQQQADQEKLKALQQQIGELEAKVKEYETLTMSGK